MKDGSEPVAFWSLMLQNSPRTELVGRWVEERRAGVDSGTNVTLVLRPDNTGTWLHDFDYITSSGGMVQSRVQQVEVRWRLENGPEAGGPSEGIILEQAGGDRPWTSKWIELDGGGLASPWRKAG